MGLLVKILPITFNEIRITGPKILEIDLSSVRSKSFIGIEVTVSLEQLNTMDYTRILLSPLFINNKEK